MIQFFCAGRIGETAGIQISNLYLDEDYFMIKDSISWCNKSKVFEYLKPFPKNKEARRVHIHPWLREIIERRLRARKKGCNFLFHVDGEPLNYCTIQLNYRLAQTKTGIPYRGTHCLWHGMATLARRVGGMGLDSVIAMTGHKDLNLGHGKLGTDLIAETSGRRNVFLCTNDFDNPEVVRRAKEIGVSIIPKPLMLAPRRDKMVPLTAVP